MNKFLQWKSWAQEGRASGAQHKVWLPFVVTPTEGSSLENSPVEAET